MNLVPRIDEIYLKVPYIKIIHKDIYKIYKDIHR